MKDNFIKINVMEKVFTYIAMVINILGIDRIINLMVKEHLYLNLEKGIKDNFLKD